MRRKRIRRELAALGYPPHYPTEANRRRVKLLAINKTEERIIADYIGVDVTVLKYWYWHELGWSETELLAFAAENLIRLAGQQNDLGVALRANEMILKTRSPAWREPRAGTEPAGLGEELPVGSLTLEQVERELARLDAEARDARVDAAPSGPAPGAPQAGADAVPAAPGDDGVVPPGRL